MSRKKNEQEKDLVNEQPEQEASEVGADDEQQEQETSDSQDDLLEQKDEEIRELKDRIQRLAAEFDNYKKRTAREKEKLYSASVTDVVASFIPVLDNVELALKASEDNDKGIREGVQMIHRQFLDTLTGLKVKPIETIGKKFDPEFHEAVMHVEDEDHEENEIIEEFRKGYIYNDEIVIRHSVVKVAN